MPIMQCLDVDFFQTEILESMKDKGLVVPVSVVDQTLLRFESTNVGCEGDEGLSLEEEVVGSGMGKGGESECTAWFQDSKGF